VLIQTASVPKAILQEQEVTELDSMAKVITLQAITLQATAQLAVVSLAVWVPATATPPALMTAVLPTRPIRGLTQTVMEQPVIPQVLVATEPGSMVKAITLPAMVPLPASAELLADMVETLSAAAPPPRPQDLTTAIS